MLTGTPTGKRSLGRPRRRWEDNNNMDLKERNWVDSAHYNDNWGSFVNVTLYLLVA